MRKTLWIPALRCFEELSGWTLGISEMSPEKGRDIVPGPVPDPDQRCSYDPPPSGPGQTFGILDALTTPSSGDP